MKDLFIYGTSVFVSFFAMMNPVASMAVFLSLTDDLSKAEKKIVAIKSLTMAFTITATVCLIGHPLFELFGITLPALRIAGGILIFLIGKEMLTGNNSEVHTPSDSDNSNSKNSKLSIAISPLGVPMLAGPGIIATAMNFSVGKTIEETISSIIAFGLLCLITCIFFLNGERFVHYIGESAIKVISRMMGLILSVIGVQLLIEGIQGAFHLTI